MSVSDKNIFWKEEELLSRAKSIIADQANEGSIANAEYRQLVDAYADLLKQVSRLTRISDKDQKRLNTLKERLSRYVSPPLYRKITSGKEKVELNQTKRVKLSIFFSDIVDFSSHSSNMEGEALSAILNSYLEDMTRIVNKYGGTLDKYIGDAILVFFGDPDFTDDFDHAQRCVRMALAMRQRMAELQDQWFKLGYSDPLHIRMGISTGFVSVGNFGSDERMDYTIIGTPVNLASRLQTAAMADQILISHDTWGLVKNNFCCSEPKRIKLKGFKSPMLAYEVFSELKEEACSEIVVEDKEKGLYLKFDPSKLNKEELIELLFP